MNTGVDQIKPQSVIVTNQATNPVPVKGLERVSGEPTYELPNVFHSARGQDNLHVSYASDLNNTPKSVRFHVFDIRPNGWVDLQQQGVAGAQRCWVFVPAQPGVWWLSPR